MGLKSNEIDHLLIRQLKLTANKPVTKPALLRTVSRWAHKLISCYNSSIISILDSSYPSIFDREAQLSLVNCQLKKVYPFFSCCLNCEGVIPLICLNKVLK